MLTYAQDTHTARWIVDKCFKGELMRSRTVILVVRLVAKACNILISRIIQTHNIALVRPIADFIVSLAHDGRVNYQGAVDESLEANAELAEEVGREEQAVEREEIEAPVEEQKHLGGKPDGKLIVAEEIEVGHVGRSACKRSIVSTGWHLTAYRQ